ncbi:TAXI family TRAP transporter solute-binding subunit [Arhodomonas sp. SL1]|uniref:TAXI family TRAP transporter solute-binding subunit n=1 Tax=Arhodomonas sp. SL1 TaxID=3425691 RepID=UPI003F883762
MGMLRRAIWATVTAALVATLVAPAAAQTRVTYKSAAAGTAYYQMGVELSEAIKAGTDGDVVVTLEESQGSVQNVMAVMQRSGNYVFTTPPALVNKAMAAEAPFEGRPTSAFEGIRGLFPIPALTMHWVVAGDGGLLGLEDLAGKHILIGRGSFGAREARRYLELFDLIDDVRIADADIGSGPDALKNGQIDGFVTASTFPAPNVIETAASMDISLVSLSDEEIEATGAAHQTIPGGTYAGIDADVETTSLPVIAYTTAAMDEQTAYTITRSFWERREAMAEESPWWAGVTPEMVGNIAGTLHPGALRYYDEAGIEVPERLR